MSVCTINSVHDIDYEQVKSDLEYKLVEKQNDYEGISQLHQFWRNECSLRSRKIDDVISKEFDEIQYEVELLKDQSECEHTSVRFHENVGHTHGGEIFKTYCTECEYEFETYRI